MSSLEPAKTAWSRGQLHLTDELMVRLLETREEGAQKIPASGRYRLAVLTSHPVQYHAPLFQRLGAHPAFDVTVFFCSRAGVSAYVDPEFDLSVQWDTPVLEGYRHAFLRNLSLRPSVNPFLGLINPGIIGVLLGSPWDAVLVHGYAHLTNWLAFAAARARRIPILLHGESTLHRRPRGLTRFVKRPVLTRLFRGVSAFLTVGTASREFYAAYGVSPDRMFPAPYAVDNGTFFEQARALAPSRETVRQRFGIGPGEVLLLFSGKLVPRKRPLDLLRALARPGLERAVAGFVGDGPLRMTLDAEAERIGRGRVRLFGFRNQRELAEFYTAADVFVLPSQFDTWGLVVNEAMCFGLPIVASTGCGVARDLVRDGWNGCTFQPADVEGLVQALRPIVADDAARTRMGARSRSLIASWSHEAAVEGILQAVQAVAGARAR